MIVLTLMRATDDVSEPHEPTCEIGAAIRGVAISRESLKALVTRAELERLPSRNLFCVAMDGGNLRASCDPEVPLTVDGADVAPMRQHVLKDRGVLTLNGVIFTYMVKYV